MKLTITTLTGDKFDVEVKAEDKVKDVKAQLYRAGRFTSAVRLLHAQALMEDDRKLCEYSLPEGATISALFEPDVGVDIEVIMGNQTQKLTVPNTTSVMTLKVQLCGVMRIGVAPEKLEIRLGEVTLEDPMPLHFYRIVDGSKLEAVKPYVNVMVETNHGTEIYWCLNRKDTIRKVKEELATSSMKTGPHPNGSVKMEQFHLYLVTDGLNFDELNDNKIVDDCKIKEDDWLYLLSYKWTQKLKVILKMAGRRLWGLEKDETCLGIKVKTQDQTGVPVSTIRLARLVEYKWVAVPYNRSYGETGFRYIQMYKKLREISDEQFPFNYKEPLSIVTDEELQADASKVKQEEKEWREKVRELQNRPDREDTLEWL